MRVYMFRSCNQFWSKGYYISTVGKHGNEDTIKNYVKGQGRENKYKRLVLFDYILRSNRASQTGMQILM